MNYGDLKTAVLAEGHRPDLTAEVAGFIRRAEGMIRRELTAYELTATLDEDDRVADGVYTLPSYVLQIRSIYTEDANARSYPIEKVGVEAIRSLTAASSVLHYATRGRGTVEFRGVPATDQAMELTYFGHPAALTNNTDENDLLTDHEVLYLYGALFYLYTHTQDVELAQGALDVFGDAIEKLNQQYGRLLGGGQTAAGYNLGNYRARGGY